MGDNPVPNFLVIDQPSQVYFPEAWPSIEQTPETNGKSDRSPDIEGVHRIFGALLRIPKHHCRAVSDHRYRACWLDYLAWTAECECCRELERRPGRVSYPRCLDTIGIVLICNQVSTWIYRFLPQLAVSGRVILVMLLMMPLFFLPLPFLPIFAKSSAGHLCRASRCTRPGSHGQIQVRAFAQRGAPPSFLGSLHGGFSPRWDGQRCLSGGADGVHIATAFQC